MIWNAYQQQALTTAIYPIDREVDYTIDGLGSEIGEFGEIYLEVKTGLWGWKQSDTKDALSELGDIFWYCAAVADALNTPLGSIMEGPAPAELYGYSKGLSYVAMTVAHGKMLGIVKKSIRDNDGYLADSHREALKTELHKIIWHTKLIIEALGGTTEAVQAANLNKLADRKQRGVLQGSGDNR